MSDDAKKMEETLEEELTEDILPEEEAKDTAEESREETVNEESKAESDGESEKDAEEEALNIKYLRLMADFQNFKRRTEKEKSDIYAFANEKIISELLNVSLEEMPYSCISA